MISRITTPLRLLRKLPPFLFSVLILVLCLSALCSPTCAQNAQGTILGHITDPTGAAIVGATVTLRNSATSITRTAKTSSVGDYVFVNVIPGEYGIVVEAQGFKKTQALKVQLQVEATLRQDFQLQPGGVAHRDCMGKTEQADSRAGSRLIFNEFV
jgi:carboxypeptidase family protein